MKLGSLWTGAKKEYFLKGTKIENQRAQLLPVLSHWIPKSLKVVNYRDISGFRTLTEENAEGDEGDGKIASMGSNKEFQTS